MDPNNATVAFTGRPFSTDVNFTRTWDKRKNILTKSRCDPKPANQGKYDALHDLNNINGFKMANLNINSLPKHIDELRVIMAD